MPLDAKVNSWKLHFLFFILYFLSIRLGIYFSGTTQTAIIWPATGLGISILMAYGKRYLPSIALAALVGNIVTGGSPIIVIGITIANVIEALIGVWAIKKIISEQNNSHSITNAIFLGTLIASAASATIGVFSLYSANQLAGSSYLSSWLVWFMGNYLAGLLIIPLFVKSSQRNNRPRKLSSVSVLTVFFIGAGILKFVFFEAEGSALLFFSVLYILLCVVVLNDKFSKFFTLLFSIGIILSTRFGSGFFHLDYTYSNLPHMQIILFSLAFSNLFMLDFKRVGSFKIPAIVLFFGFCAANVFFYSFYIINYHKNLEAYRENIADAVKSIKKQIETNTTALKSGTGLMAASRTVERNEWKIFVDQLGDQVSSYGMMGMGVVFRINKDKLNEFLAQTKNDGAPDFKIHNVSDNTIQSNEFFIITYIEPLSLHKQAVGLNLASELNRKNAADLATDSGELSISEHITLVQDANKQKAFLIFYPVYSHGPIPTSIKERRARSIGWIYSPVKVKDFIDAALGVDNLEHLSYSLVKNISDQILANSGDFYNLPSYYEIERLLKIANQTYTIRFKPHSNFITDIATTSSWAGISAVMLTVLLAAFVSFTQTAEQRAILLVDQRTKQLEITGRIAKLGGWELDLIQSKIFWSKITREIHEFTDVNEPDPQTALSFYKEGSDREAITEALNLAIKDGTSWDLELRIITTKGKEKWVRVIGQIALENNKVVRIFGTFQDITDRINLQQQLADERLKSIQTSKLASLGEMSAGMAHEINNPLTIILSTTAHLTKYIDDPKKLNAKIEIIKKATERIAKIVKGLKKFSRSSEENNFKDVSLAEIVNESLILIESKLKHTEIKLQCDIVSNALIYCDEIEIEQVVINLINNAIDAAENGAEHWIKIKISDDSQYVILNITDSGPVIAEKIREKIFEPFFTTKSVGKGTGLGLSISKGILDEHNALIGISFSPNTCFEIRFLKKDVT